MAMVDVDGSSTGRLAARVSWLVGMRVGGHWR